MSSQNPSKNSRPPAQGKRRLKRYSIACFRLGIIVAALLCIRAAPRETRPDINPDLVLAEAKTVFPNTASLGPPADKLFPLLNQDQETIGWATTTFPQARKIQGYSGPSELLVIFDSQRLVKAVRFIASADTDGHVKKVRDDPAFWSQWNGQAETVLGASATPTIVSGATLTSEAMARGIAARFGAQGMDQWFPEPLQLTDLKKHFPNTTRIDPLSQPGTYQISSDDETLGIVLRSSRMGVSARGFNGTSDVIVAIDPTGKKILGIGLLGSRDNEPYVGDVSQEVLYADGFAGKTPAEIIAGSTPQSPFLFTSGASYTNHAVVESVREMLRRHQAETTARTISWKHLLALLWIALGLFLGLHKSGSNKHIRIAFALISVAAGLTLGWMVSQDQLIGWARHGLQPLKLLPLLVLTAVAFVIPAFTGKNVYCNRICPHGAAQTLAGKAIKKRFALPPKLHSIMARIPWLAVIAIWILALIGSDLPFSHLEPFETWSTGFIAFIPATIFTVGILAAFFLPQGYCHYGCPTGALFKFLTHAPGRWTSKDTIALILILTATVSVTVART